MTADTCDPITSLPLVGLAPVRVTVTNIPVEHTVRIRYFTNWVERNGGSPREVTDRDKVRAILGLAH